MNRTYPKAPTNVRIQAHWYVEIAGKKVIEKTSIENALKSIGVKAETITLEGRKWVITIPKGRQEVSLQMVKKFSKKLGNGQTPTQKENVFKVRF